MPAWLAAAFNLLAGTPARGLLTGATLGGAVSAIPGFSPLDVIPGFPGAPGKRRRRRRRALTASDRADIAFIAGMLGQPAGRQFAMLIGSRTAS